jgi:catechol 2,3-dioxygenase-like lactoylglutathione lyase family enzyme
MRVKAIRWLGTRTEQHDATAAFFRDVLGLPVEVAEHDFTVLRVPDGATVEVFGPGSEFNAHLTHPVAGFLVDDLSSAAAELEAAGAEIVLPRQDGDEGRAWLHFRAPDGFVYELTQEREP